MIRVTKMSLKHVAKNFVNVENKDFQDKQIVINGKNIIIFDDADYMYFVTTKIFEAKFIKFVRLTKVFCQIK